MPGRDYEGIHDIEGLSDGELKALIEQELTENPDIEQGDFRVAVSEGSVRLEGRVGTEQEYQAIEHVVTDLLGIQDVQNDMVVDALRRSEQSEAADMAAADRAGLGDAGSDGAADRTSDEANHLMNDTAGEQFGTSDMSEAIQNGFSYNPPDNPVQEGSSREDH